MVIYYQFLEICQGGRGEMDEAIKKAAHQLLLRAAFFATLLPTAGRFG